MTDIWFPYSFPVWGGAPSSGAKFKASGGGEAEVVGGGVDTMV